MAARLRVASGFVVRLVVHATLLVILGLVVVWHEVHWSAHGVTLLPFVEDPGPVSFVEELSMRVPALPADVLGAFAVDPTEMRLPDSPNIRTAPSLLAGLDRPEPAAGPQSFTSNDPGGLDRRCRAAAGSKAGTRTAPRPAGRSTGRFSRERIRRRARAGLDGGSPAARGGWRFDHHDGPCGGLCRDPGNVGSTTAATGWPCCRSSSPARSAKAASTRRWSTTACTIFAAGCCHALGGDLQEGTMYGQGIAAIAAVRGLRHDAGRSLRSRPNSRSISSAVRSTKRAAGATSPASPAIRPSSAGN